MAKVPVITSPCPLRFTSAPQAGMDFCGQCQRRVHNLDGMSDGERESFFAACSGDVCVAYTVKRAPRVAVIGLAALSATVGVAAIAQQVTVNDPPSPYCDYGEVIVGGTSAGEALQWVDENEAKRPDNEVLPNIDASEWLPTPEGK